jgi:hypothetical protein
MSLLNDENIIAIGGLIRKQVNLVNLLTVLFKNYLTHLILLLLLSLA